jgi:hypothetical protein
MLPVDNTRAALDQAYEHALDWPDGSRSATRMPSATAEQLLRSLDGPLQRTLLIQQRSSMCLLSRPSPDW